jgi:flagellar protein FlbD
MIQLTRLNHKPLIVNSDLIKFVEQSPDTLVTLITGEKIVVLEHSGEVLARVVAFRRSVLQGLPQIWDPSSSHPSSHLSSETSVAPPTGPPGPEPER